MLPGSATLYSADLVRSLIPRGFQAIVSNIHISAYIRTCSSRLQLGPGITPPVNISEMTNTQRETVSVATGASFKEGTTVAPCHSYEYPDSPKSEKDTTKVSSSSISSHRRSHASRSAVIPANCVRLDVLLLSGHRKFFDFTPSTSVNSVRETIFSQWPPDWPSRPASISAIRILHLGYILDDKAVLSTTSSSGGARSSCEVSTSGTMTLGRSNVVHLLIRQDLPDDHGDDESLKKRDTSEDTGCCNCVIC